MPQRSSSNKGRFGSTEYATNPFEAPPEEAVAEMDDDPPPAPALSAEFADNTGPSLSSVLEKYRALILADALPMIGLEEWEKDVDESRIRMEQARRIARENLARRANP